MTMSKILSLFFLCVTILSGNDKLFEKIFKEFSIDGTLIISTLKSDELYVYNEQRADKRFCSASTFKIPHTLIALNENIITSKNDVIKWDRVKRGYDLWNKDQTLQSAISISSFWLNDNLKISAYEQIDFLKKLYNENLPISRKHINTVKDIITVDKNERYELKSKSGWDGIIGWYVGYVKSNGKVYFFAFNGDTKREQLNFRKEIVYKALKSKKII